MDPHFLRTNLNSIPKNCTKLIITGKFLKPGIFRGKQAIIGDTNLSSYRLNEKLKTFTELQILDFSKCTEITEIYSGFSHLGVKEIILPPNVQELPCIYYCPNLLSIIGKGLIRIANIVGCPLLEKIEFNPLLEYISVPNTNIRDINLENLSEIQYGAFENCINLNKVTFSDKLKRIGNKSFKNCKNLYALDIPDSCLEIGLEAFKSCSSLRYLKLSNCITTIDKDVFANCIELKYITGGTAVAKLLSGSFSNCINLWTLPFHPKNIDTESFENIPNNLYGIIMTTYTSSIIWCFNDLQFYHCSDRLEHELKGKVIRFNGSSRVNIDCLDNGGIRIERNPCKLAKDIEVLTDYDDVPYHYRASIEKLSMLPESIPSIGTLFIDMTKKVEKLDIENIIASYSTYASESQTWKVGGDNTFHHYIKTSIKYTDCYLESLLPNVDEEYHESACHNYDDEIDYDIQNKYCQSDERFKKAAIINYDRTKHIDMLVNDYIRCYINDCKEIEKILHVEYARNVVNYYFAHLHKDYKRLLSLSILCGDVSPELNYENWLRQRSEEIFG